MVTVANRYGPLNQLEGTLSSILSILQSQSILGPHLSLLGPVHLAVHSPPDPSTIDGFGGNSMNAVTKDPLSKVVSKQTSYRERGHLATPSVFAAVSGVTLHLHVATLRFASSVTGLATKLAGASRSPIFLL